MSTEVIHHVTWHMALLPCVTLALLRATGRSRDVAWWWLAVAYLVSWLADAAAYFALDPWLVSLIYPVTQAGIVALVFLHRDDVPLFVFVMLFVGIGAALWRGVQGPDVLLRTVAWLTVAGIAVERWELGRLRAALLVTFGIGWLCWIGYAVWPGWTSWSLYQCARALGIGLFCWSAIRPVQLRILRA